MEKENTAEKIRNAARKLFTELGYGRVTTRDIATAAGVNAALVNYHFRSKEQLFQEIMVEVVRGFMSQMQVLLNDGHSFEEKLELLVNNYYQLLSRQPDLPIFMLSEIRNNPKEMVEKLGVAGVFKEAGFFRELAERCPQEMLPIQLFLNLISMTVFPFIARPIVQNAAGFNDEQFSNLIAERQVHISQWFISMLEPVK